MPGFSIGGTGGTIPGTIETRRQHRWRFTALINDGLFPEIARLILQSAQRPNFKFEEPEMHHNQEVVRFAGKQDWEPVKLTWYDAENPDVSKSLYDWIQLVVNLVTIQVSPPSEYKKQAELSMINGVGTATENWRLYNCWPKECNWNDLTYTESEIVTIEATMRFDRAHRL